MLTGAADVHAGEGPTRVALIEDPADSSILPRLRAELTGLGLDVTLVPRKADEQLPRDLIEAARAADAAAAFRIVLGEGQADVWIADRVTGKVVLREMLPRGAQIDGRVVALRAVELLRVSLLELDVRRPPVEDAPMRESLPRDSALLEDLERSSLSADSSFLWSPGGAGIAVGVDAAVAWRPTWIGVRLFGGSVLAPATISSTEGSGEITTRWLGVDAIVQPRRTRMRWRPRLGVGFAALSTELRGNAHAPWISNQRTVYAVSPRASADLGFAVHSRLRIGLGLSYFRPLHKSQELMVLDRSVGEYGAHILVASLGLDLALP
jgi:hypothetical protein